MFIFFDMSYGDTYASKKQKNTCIHFVMMFSD